MPRRALLSVWDKEGLVEFGQGLAALGWELVASGGTARALRAAGLPVTEVAQVTGFPEMLGGRVKTLHPAIHAGLLARPTPSDLEELAAHGLAPMDLVAVNLYPFEATVARPGVTLEEAVEQIDIGGVALLRAAAKNWARVAVVSQPSQYAGVLAELREQGQVTEATRRRLALEAFRLTAAYDAAIAAYLAGQGFSGEEAFPARLVLAGHLAQVLRYGENPHQAAAYYTSRPGEGPLGGRLLGGKPLSYNNLLDLDAAWRAASSLAEPAVAIIKHTNPCGLARAHTILEAYRRALEGDPVSAFGSVVAANRPVDREAAEAMVDLFIEVLAAPAFASEAVALFQERRPNTRLVTMGDAAEPPVPWEVRSVRGGFLLQEPDPCQDDPAQWQVVTKRAPTPEEWHALEFGWKAVAHVKSNAIVLCHADALVGVGAGQMSRVDAVRVALMKAGDRARGAALASDAFFPFPDGVAVASEAGVTAVVQPGGAQRDAEVIAEADRRGMAMVFTGRRHFRH
ncbi:MAG: bifunctional phosphoribosylaminoimidazolecarboxamide formyltransferase/IMP cyclohydrolase [Anaerolineae bacterium]|nr:bifunctional phosphoribosylaminoimidazolecarboxamide formyltransferase/IMP cyclohydrolase [Anaerolineae bacterium]